MGDRGPASNDARHRVTTSGTIDLPWDCHVSTVLTARTALPYNITTGRDDNRDGVTNDRPPGVGRNAARGSASFDADVRVSKLIVLGRSRIELRAEVFNLTNASNWTNYQGNQLTTLTFGQPAGSGPPRQLQLGARFDF